MWLVSQRRDDGEKSEVRESAGRDPADVSYRGILGRYWHWFLVRDLNTTSRAGSEAVSLLSRELPTLTL